MKKNSIKSKKRINKTKLKNRQIKKNRHLQKYNTRKKIIGGNASEIKRLLLEKLSEIKNNLDILQFSQVYDYLFSQDKLELKSDFNLFNNTDFSSENKLYESNLDKTVAIFLDVYEKSKESILWLSDLNEFIRLIVKFFNSNDPIFISILDNGKYFDKTLNNKNNLLKPGYRNLPPQDFNGRLSILSNTNTNNNTYVNIYNMLQKLLLNYVIFEKNKDEIKTLEEYKIFKFLFIKDKGSEHTRLKYILDRITKDANAGINTDVNFIKYKFFIKSNINTIIESILKSYIIVCEEKKNPLENNIDLLNNILLIIFTSRLFIINITKPDSDFSAILSESILKIYDIYTFFYSDIYNNKKTILNKILNFYSTKNLTEHKIYIKDTLFDIYINNILDIIHFNYIKYVDKKKQINSQDFYYILYYFFIDTKQINYIRDNCTKDNFNIIFNNLLDTYILENIKKKDDSTNIHVIGRIKDCKAVVNGTFNAIKCCSFYKTNLGKSIHHIKPYEKCLQLFDSVNN